MKTYVFFFHYNKPASKLAGSPKLSIHWRKLCSIVDEVVCNVPCNSKNNKRQPHCVMVGKAYNIEFNTLDNKLVANIN